jgi:hypothetical protein
MVWNTETFRPSTKETMDKTIKILKQTIISNDVAKVGTVHTLPAQIADMHVGSGNAEFVEADATNRAVGVQNSDSTPKKRKKK